MLHRYLRNRRGFTLIEIVTAMALLGLVTLMVFSFFSYGNAAFLQGKRQNNVQAELRIVNDYVVQELRFATSVTLSPSHPGTIDRANARDYIYLDGDRIVHSAYNSGNARVVRQWGSGLLPTSGFWSSHSGTAQVMGVSLFGQEGGQTFDIQTSIELPNLALANSSMPITTNAKTISFLRDYTILPPGPPAAPPTTYRLTVSPSILGGGTAVVVAPDGTGSYVRGPVSVLATPNDGYRFTGWTLGAVVVSTDPQYDFDITADTHLVAVFEQLNPPIIVNVAIIVERPNNANVQYRVTLGAVGPRDTVQNGNLHTATFLNVIGGEPSSPRSYEVVVEFFRRQGNQDTWVEVHRSTLAVRNIHLAHRIPNND